jgi:hypothetical protein
MFGPRLLPSLAVVLLAAACDASPVFHTDGAPDRDGDQPQSDVALPSDGSGPLFAAVSATGCAELVTSETGTECRGVVPLRVSFSAVAPPEATTFIWDFGDGSEPAVTAVAEHTFAYPGPHAVQLVIGGPFGTYAPPTSFVVAVSAAAIGGFCEEDAQCASADCLCTGEAAADCPAALRGLCTVSCELCPVEDFCADLRVGAGAPDSLWRDELCLPGCAEDQTCSRPGFVCRELPVEQPLGARQWHPVCFPNVLQDVGAGCLDGGGVPTDALCLSGRCAALGQFGLCADGCAATPCPSYADCVQFSGGPFSGEPLCLARCSASRPCTSDPALACELPSADGELGFVTLDASAPEETTWCAPRRCATSLDCPWGVCDQTSGGFCH